MGPPLAGFICLQLEDHVQDLLDPKSQWREGSRLTCLYRTLRCMLSGPMAVSGHGLRRCSLHLRLTSRARQRACKPTMEPRPYKRPRFHASCRLWTLEEGLMTLDFVSQQTISIVDSSLSRFTSALLQTHCVDCACRDMHLAFDLRRSRTP